MGGIEPTHKGFAYILLSDVSTEYMAIEFVSKADPRFPSFNRGKNNGRFTFTEGSASGIALCYDENDVDQALEDAILARKRPTIRSGGHCYEGFVYDNPGGTIIDLRNMNGITQDPVKKRGNLRSALP
jgi:hypothetical protein